jgi:geranylgeranyl pyrophosphate synthase
MLQLSTTLDCRIDDIQDNSSLHRGIPAAHTVYGVARTISAAIYVIFISLHRALNSDQTQMIKFLTEMMVETWRGQAIEIY